MILKKNNQTLDVWEELEETNYRLNELEKYQIKLILMNFLLLVLIILTYIFS